LSTCKVYVVYVADHQVRATVFPNSQISFEPKKEPVNSRTFEFIDHFRVWSNGKMIWRPKDDILKTKTQLSSFEKQKFTILTRKYNEDNGGDYFVSKKQNRPCNEPKWMTRNTNLWRTYVWTLRKHLGQQMEP